MTIGPADPGSLAPVQVLGGPSANRRIIVSVDAMGGDRGPSAIVAGMVESAARNPDIAFILHGDEALLKRLVAKKRVLEGRCTLRHAPRTVTMSDKPGQVMRHGLGTSMWSCIESVKLGEATVAVSCGNTGALMALSMIRLRKLPVSTAPPSPASGHRAAQVAST